MPYKVTWREAIQLIKILARGVKILLSRDALRCHRGTPPELLAHVVKLMHPPARYVC